MHVKKRDLFLLQDRALLSYQEAATLTGTSRSAISQAVKYKHLVTEATGPYHLLRKKDVLTWQAARGTLRGWPKGKTRKAA